ncbi:MAG: signal recognition particle-docking protein FtsY [Eubacteriales bacterium]|nr:signal recognition particle-docking protein FtsY [Clostridiales bacterium]MDY3759817.1 signal recognition particle-docking protein FtsY [Eubacteriales bacterium]
MGFFSKIKEGLKKTRTSIGDGFNAVFSVFKKVDEDFLEELLELLIMADVGYDTSERIIGELRKKAKLESLNDPESVKNALAQIIAEAMTGENGLNISTSPSVILVVGVNGVGKTTTIGKLAHRLSESGKKVIIGAADTFRAAAIDQISVWAERSGTDIVRHQDGADPAAVVFDTIAAAKARKADVIICDTAGRLHNKKNLMGELEKIMRVIDRELPDADKEILLVLDATTGQNAIEQAKDFKEAVGVTGVALTKLDGTAKGGITIAVKDVTGVPVKLVGVGEGIDDLQYFEPDAFAKALVGIEETE